MIFNSSGVLKSLFVSSNDNSHRRFNFNFNDRIYDGKGNKNYTALIFYLKENFINIKFKTFFIVLNLEKI